MDKGSKKQTLIIKLVCVLLSFGLWLYITNIENPTRSYTLKGVPVKLLNTQTLKQFDLAVSPDQTFDVNLSLEGDSKDIYSVEKDQFSLVADIGEYALKTGVNNIPVQVVNYPEKLNIKNNNNLIVQVKLEKLISKEFNVISQVDVNYAYGVYKDKEKFTSSKVEVSGPESAVNKVVNVAMVGELDNVNRDITKEFLLKPLDANGDVVKDVKLSKDKEKMSVYVSNSKAVDIKTNYIGNLPDGYKLISTIPSKKSVQIIGEKNDLDSVNSLNTEDINLSDIKESTQKKVKILLPEGISLADEDNYVTVNINVEPIKENDNNSTNKNENSTNTNTNTNINTNTNNNNNTTNNNNSDANNAETLKTTKTLEIPVNYTGLSDDLKMSDESKSVNITIEGNKEDISNISTDDFVCNFDLNNFKQSGTFEENCNVSMVNSKQNVSISSVDKIKFTLNKKSTQPTTTDNVEDKNKDKDKNSV